jgi:hypothetical protein
LPETLIKELRLVYAPAGACADISRLRATLAISCNVSVCKTTKLRCLPTGASSSRAAKADTSSTSTAAVSLPFSLIDSSPAPKGGLYAWEQVQQCPEVIFVEGLFDYAVLWRTGFVPEKSLLHAATRSKKRHDEQ